MRGKHRQSNALLLSEVAFYSNDADGEKVGFVLERDMGTGVDVYRAVRG